MAIDSISPILLNALRWQVALLLLLPLGWKAVATAKARALIADRWKYLAILGLLGMGTYNALQYLALHTSTPVNVTLIASSLPVWTLLIGTLFYQSHPSRVQLIGAALSLAGVATVLSRGDPSALLHIQLVQGDLLMVAAIIGWAFYSWMLAKPPANMRGAERPAWNWAEFLVVQCIFGIVWNFASTGIEAVVAPPMQTIWSWSIVATVAFVAIGPSIIAYRSWGVAVGEAGPAVAAVFNNLTPLLAALLSAAVIGEWPKPYHGVAFALIVSGILVSSRTTAPGKR
jgi:drug/metabolite transporter (DMT)-like permease